MHLIINSQLKDGMWRIEDMERLHLSGEYDPIKWLTEGAVAIARDKEVADAIVAACNLDYNAG